MTNSIEGEERFASGEVSTIKLSGVTNSNRCTVTGTPER
jgi:hypothetical protein